MPATSTADLIANADRLIAAVTALEAARYDAVKACHTTDAAACRRLVLAALDAVDAAQLVVDDLGRERLSVSGGTVMPLAD